MKKTVSFAVIVFTLLAISSKSYAQTKQYENRYFYLYVPGGTQHFITVEYKQHSTSTYLKTRQDASVRLDALEAEISDDNYKINHTNFSFSCD